MKRKIIVTISICTVIITIIAYFAIKEEKTVAVKKQITIKQKDTIKPKPTVARKIIKQPNFIIPPCPADISPRKWSYLVDGYEREVAKNIPIEFCAKVIDQFGNTVVNAEVDMTINKTKKSLLEILDSGKSYYGDQITKYTNTEGEFSVNDFGQTVKIKKISKPGYISLINKGVFYNKGSSKKNMTANKDKPFIFTLIDKTECDPLYVRSAWSQKLLTHGEIYYIDFKTGKILENPTSNSTLTVTLHLGEERKITERKAQHDWGFVLAAIDGGLYSIASINDIYIAPEDGYQEEFIFDTIDLKKWKSNYIGKCFYYNKIKNRYSLLSLNIIVASDYVQVRIKDFLNPSGSRNLAYDYKKRLQKYPE